MLFKTIFNGESGNFQNIRTFKLSDLKSKESLKKWWNKTPYDLDLVKEFNVEADKLLKSDINNIDDAFEKLKKTFSDKAGDDKLTGTLFLNAKKGVEVTVDAIDNLSPAAKAGKIALKGLAAVGNMFASWAVMFAIEKTIEVIVSCATASEKLKNAARELGNEFKQESDSINDYKTRIEELYSVINDQTSSVQETYNARKQLLSVQSEMIDRFGSEAEVIDLVTKSINGQTSALLELSKVKWQEKLNAFNANEGVGFFERIGIGISNLFNGYSSNSERMLDEMENASIDFDISSENKLDDKKYSEFSKLITDIYGVNLDYIDEYGDSRFSISGDLDEIYDKLINIQSLAKDFGLDGIHDSISKTANGVKNTLDSYDDLYNQYVLYEKIFVNDNYKKSFDEINNAYREYEKAFESGNQDAIDNAMNNFSEVVYNATDGLKDDSVVEYFEELYPELQAEVATWKFKVNFEKVDDTTLKDDVKDYVGNFGSTDELLNFDSATATNDQIEAYNQLKQISDDYGYLSFDSFVKDLEKLGAIKSQSYQDLVNLFGEDKLSKYSESEIQALTSHKNVKGMYESRLTNIIKENEQVYNEEIEKISEWGLDEYKDGIVNQSLQHIFGNVDMDKRTIIKWSNELKNTYKDELASWDYNPEVGSIDTVFGSSDRFGENLNGTGWEVAFTPILPDGTFLSKDAVYDYINNILIEAYSDDEKVTEEELKEIDLQGRQVGNTFIQGIFAGIDAGQEYENNGNWAEVIGRLMHFMGNFGSVQLFSKNDVSTTEAEVEALNQVVEAITEITEEYKKLTFAKQMQGIHGLSEGLDQLDTIMADVIDGETFDYASILDPEGSFTITFGKFTDEYETFIETITNSPKDLSKCQDAFDDLATAYVYSTDALSNLTTETKNASILNLEQMGVKNAEEIVTTMLDDYTVALNAANAAGVNLEYVTYNQINALVSEQNALNGSGDAIYNYYLRKQLLSATGISTADDCQQLINLASQCKTTAEHVAILTRIMNLYNNVVHNDMWGPETKALAEKEVNSLKNQLLELSIGTVKFGNGAKSMAAAQEKAADATDKVTDALEKEKSKLEDIKAEYDLLYDAVMWFYDKQIEKIDDKIDALNEENERLQEQQENMDRILAAIEANYDAEIKLIQDKIDALKDENDEEERALALEEAKRKLQEAKSRKTLMVYQKGVGFTYQVDTKAITEAEEELEELQENEVVAELEKQIEKLEEAKNKWSEIPEAYEKAMQEIAAMNYFGKNWKEITLNPSDSLLNSFEGKYTGIQSSIDKNEDRVERYEKEKEKIEELKKAWEDAKNAYQYYQYETKLAEYFGSDYEYQLLNNSKVWRQQYAEEYSNLCAQIEALEQKIKAANDETANAAITNAQTIKTANEETVKSAEALSNSVSQAETATGSVVDEAGAKVDNIAQVINTLKDAIFNLITNINILYQTMTEIDSISLGNLMAQFGAGSSNGSFEGGMVVTGVMTKPSEGSEESASGGSGLLGAINSVIEAVDKLKDISIKELNDTELTDIINRFGVLGDNGATEDSLLSAINNVSNTITGEGNVESGLIPSIKELGSDATSGHIFKVQNSFHTLMQEITGVIKQIDALIDKINSIPKVPSIGGNSKGTGTAFTFAIGTAFSGNAYASGTGKWGLSSDKPGSLVAEQGSEIVVRDGKYRLISSPTLMDLKKGDIVFNHKQTEAIMKNGSKPVIDKIANKNEKIVNDLKGFAFAEGTIKEKIFEAIMNGISLIMNPKDVIPKFAQNIKKLPENPSEQKVEIHIGDIHVHGVDNVNDFADDILKYLPNALLQKINKK